jgi:hypothetical protein
MLNNMRSDLYKPVTAWLPCEHCGTNRAQLRLRVDGRAALCFSCGNDWAADVANAMPQWFPVPPFEAVQDEPYANGEG